MSDQRTLREKLEAMASQDASPHEAAIAQAMLADMGAGDREPPRTAVGAPGASWDWTWATGTTTATASGNVYVTWDRTR